jgi:Mg2+ and Co2+ transporter CorA
MYIFLLRDGNEVPELIMYLFLIRFLGTVISFSSVTDTEFTAPILNRLRQRDTGLRTSADASLLVQSLLDLIVDQALEVVDEYQGTILKLEQSILIRPKMRAIRACELGMPLKYAAVSCCICQCISSLAT